MKVTPFFTYILPTFTYILPSHRTPSSGIYLHLPTQLPT